MHPLSYYNGWLSRLITPETPLWRRLGVLSESHRLRRLVNRNSALLFRSDHYQVKKWRFYTKQRIK